MFTLHGAETSQQRPLAALAIGESDSAARLGALQVTSVPLELRGSQFDLSLVLAEVDGRIIGEFEYATALFEPATIARMGAYYQRILHAITRDPVQVLDALDMLPAAERELTLQTWNATGRDYPQDDCIHHLIARQTEQTPDAIAIIDAHGQISYRDLLERANRLAGRLQRQGVGSETRIGIWLDRSSNMVMALLGVLIAGGAYVPLDPNYPRDRVAFMVEDAQIAAIITQRELIDRLPEHSAPVILIDEADGFAGEPSDAQRGVVQPDNLAYVIYTSGSTGRPKGVALTHRNAVNFLRWALEAFTADDLARVVASTSICFDLSIFEIFGPLATGGAVIMVPSIMHLASVPATHQATLVNTVPSALSEFLALQALPATTRVVNLAGEPLPMSLVRRLADAGIPAIFNSYGPSEATTYATYTPVTPDDSVVTIGRPVANTTLYVLDAHLRPVPLGVAGELFIGGIGVARGYLNRPALTAERFLPDPFSVVAGRRMYRTGDRVRYRADGMLEYQGRFDHQVKIRGFRIELGEIEATLCRHEAVREALVVAHERAANDQRLIAYVIPTAPLADAEEDRLATQLRAHVRGMAPEYMVPATVIVVPAWPLNPNGKLDRARLPAPEWDRAASGVAYVAPRTTIELKLATIWEAALGAPRIGVHDNFFDLGGHSLLAMQVIAHIREDFAVDLPLTDLFTRPTIAQLALLLAELQPAVATAAIPALPRGSRSLAQFTPTELDRMLAHDKGVGHE